MTCTLLRRLLRLLLELPNQNRETAAARFAGFFLNRSDLCCKSLANAFCIFVFIGCCNESTPPSTFEPSAAKRIHAGSGLSKRVDRHVLHLARVGHRTLANPAGAPAITRALVALARAMARMPQAVVDVIALAQIDRAARAAIVARLARAYARLQIADAVAVAIGLARFCAAAASLVLAELYQARGVPSGANSLVQQKAATMQSVLP